jgi:NTP pyrophosphatase (non-canonical NTP hydrolase)
MTFEEFKANVRAWSAERGIYEHSTALAQALKAVSEVGELADAVIKGDRDALIDAIGDVAVCLVNVATMAGLELVVHPELDANDPEVAAEIAASAAMNVVSLASTAGYRPNSKVTGYMRGALRDLIDLAAVHGTTFDACCEAAWSQIKDRKGRMVAGGAFVKESEA